MSFNHYARKVMSPACPWASGTARCTPAFSGWSRTTGEPFAEARPDSMRDPGSGAKTRTDHQLLAALALIERERNLALQQLRAYERRRESWRESARQARHPGERAEGAAAAVWHGTRRRVPPEPHREITRLPEERSVERLRGPAPEDV